jgi:hypothetical protein
MTQVMIVCTLSLASSPISLASSVAESVVVSALAVAKRPAAISAKNCDLFI